MIDGIMYRFGKDGICSGKYTGWASSRTARYYYKNGIKLKNCWLKSGGKRTYFLQKNGKMATGTVTVAGISYTFSENGKLIVS